MGVYRYGGINGQNIILHQLPRWLECAWPSQMMLIPASPNSTLSPNLLCRRKLSHRKIVDQYRPVVMLYI